MWLWLLQALEQRLTRPSWRREAWTGGLDNTPSPWAAGFWEGAELELCQGSGTILAIRIAILCLSSVMRLIWVLAAPGWWWLRAGLRMPLHLHLGPQSERDVHR